MTTTLHYLGPRGSFTHQAAVLAADLLEGDVELVAEPNVSAIFEAVRKGRGWGVVAWENNVEGYVVPNLDALIDARDIAGFARVGVDIVFDAFVRPDHGELTTARAHPHGLAQCTAFTAEHGLTPQPAASNAAACRDILPNEVAYGPRICGSLYGLQTMRRGVQDYDGGHTEFLVLAPRTQVRSRLSALKAGGVREYESIVAFIPLITGPGVLANLLDLLRDSGLNMTSFISRPIKGNAGTYSFIATIDAAPWEAGFRSAMTEIIEHGDWMKTLAVYPRRERPSPPVSAWMLPEGGVHMDDIAEGALEGYLRDHEQDAATMDKELLWD